MRTRPHALLGGALCGAALLACAAHSPMGKGGLVPLDVPRERTAGALAPRRLALLVGIQGYDDPQWRELRYPAADAAALAAVLRDPERGAFDDVEVLAAGPTRDEVRAALRRLADRSRDPGDTVLVYFSSHGTLARDGMGALRRYVVARDTRVADVPATGLSMDELKADFDRLRSRRKVLVLATCHSGTGKSLLPDDVQAELAGIKAGFFVRPIEEVSKASVVLAASDWGETAREDEKLGNDVYTHFLVEALRVGADRNGDGAVTASEAHDYARRMTYEWTGGRQRPSAESTEVGADAIVLAGKVARRGRPELFSYAARLDGFTLRVDGKPLAELPGGIAVDPGRHRVQVAKGGGPEVWGGWIRMGEGERIDVEHLVERGSTRLELAPRAGGLSFLDARSRRDVLGPVPALGAAVSYADWPRPAMSLRLDLATSAGTSRIRQGPHAAEFRYTVYTAGASLPWRFTPASLGGASLLAGPRLSAFWLDRRFALALAPAGQTWFAFSPGVLLGASVPLGGRVTLGAELHLDFSYVRVDGENRSSGLGELLLGAGYRF
ncbi:MAG TPA: caspase family protein [Anaeromyxobacter sp.]